MIWGNSETLLTNRFFLYSVMSTLHIGSQKILRVGYLMHALKNYFNRFITANCACSRKALQLTGGLDEEFTMAWREDTALEFDLCEKSIPIIKVTDAIIVHPVRTANWGISIREQKKGMYNALLYKKHTWLYEKSHMERTPRYYYLITLMLLLALIFSFNNASLMTGCMMVWLLLTGWFTWKRLKNTSRTLLHITEMAFTSAIIPVLSVYWTIYGAVKFNILCMMRFDNEKPKIALFRALQLGDMLCAVPAIRALRFAYRQADIALIGLPWASAFVQRFAHYINRHIVFPGYPGLPEQSFSQAEWDQFITRMQQEKFDCILQMQGNGTIVNEMLQQLQAKQLAGFHQQDSRMDPAWFVQYPEGEHEVMRHLLLMKHLGIPDEGVHMEFPISEQQEAELREVAPFVHQEPYVCVHPGSRNTARQWSPCYFAALADYCAEHGYRVVLTGTKDETHITEYVEALMTHKNKAVNLAGKTSLGVIAPLIKHADLLIANCTGVSHIAAATKTPSLIISMDGEAQRWGPMNDALHHVFDWTQHKSFTEVFHQLASLINSMQKKENAISKVIVFQSGKMGFIAQ
jgi:ADP-heptose:LPS heptosyltransferase